MILQDLLRNIVTYKGIIKPLLKVWQGYLLDMYNAQQKRLVLIKEQRRQLEVNGNELKASNTAVLLPLSHTGTLTITSPVLEVDKKTFRNTSKNDMNLATVSSNSSIMLGVGGLVKEIVKTEQIHINQYVTCVETASFVLETTDSRTTGSFTLEICYFLFFEIHEKGEPLGERSLSHDDALVINFKEGGEQS